MQPELKPQPQKYSALVIIGAVATTILAIAGLTWLGKYLSEDKGVVEQPKSIPEKTTAEKMVQNNTLFANGKPWSTITDTGENYNHLRFLSVCGNYQFELFC